MNFPNGHICLMLYVLITCLNIVFIKTCVYTCTISDLYLTLMFGCFNAHVYSLDVLVWLSFDDSCIFTCISYFCIYFVFIFMYMQILSKLLDIYVYPWVTCFSCKFYYELNCVWICMYTSSLDKTYIYLEAYLVL